MIILMEDEAVEIAKSVLERSMQDENFRKMNYGGQIMVLGTAISLLGIEYITKMSKEKSNEQK